MSEYFSNSHIYRLEHEFIIRFLLLLQITLKFSVSDMTRNWKRDSFTASPFLSWFFKYISEILKEKYLKVALPVFLELYIKGF